MQDLGDEYNQLKKLDSKNKFFYYIFINFISFYLFIMLLWTYNILSRPKFVTSYYVAEDWSQAVSALAAPRIAQSCLGVS